MKPEYSISGEDVDLRTITEEDIEALRLWRNQDSIRKSFVYSDVILPEQQLQWYQRYVNIPDDFMFIAHYKGSPVGASALYNIDFNKHTAEFGRLMLGDTKLRGLGIGKRITALTTQLGFQQLGLDSIYLEVFQSNSYAKSIYEALGYAVTGSDSRNGIDVWLMCLKREAWSK